MSDVVNNSNIDCLQGNTTDIYHPHLRFGWYRSYCPEGSQYYLNIPPFLASLENCSLRAVWMVWICWETADSILSSRRLNSSKQPQAPTWHRPTKIRPIAWQKRGERHRRFSGVFKSVMHGKETDPYAQRSFWGMVKYYRPNLFHANINLISRIFQTWACPLAMATVAVSPE